MSFFFGHVREAAKIKMGYFLNGSAIKKGGGGKGLAIKKKKLFYKFLFYLLNIFLTSMKLEGERGARH